MQLPTSLVVIKSKTFADELQKLTYTNTGIQMYARIHAWVLLVTHKNLQ